EETNDYIKRELSLANMFKAAGLDEHKVQSTANMMAASPEAFELLKNGTRRDARDTFNNLLPHIPAALERFEKHQANAVQAKALAVSQESTVAIANLSKKVETLERNNEKLMEENGEMKSRLEENEKRLEKNEKRMEEMERKYRGLLLMLGGKQ
ncbi:hypothetical protein PFISCL1PPCAC_10979, partial [Pristionchus fissidentatus]